MRRTGHLLERVADPDNLKRAFLLAARGKRRQAVVQRFAADLDTTVLRMGQELRSGTIGVGRYHRFVVRDPKRRVIHACPFEERVMHHALMAVCGPILERTAIADSYACRLGKGRHRAVARAWHWCRRRRWYLRLDVRRYYDSVDHAILLDQLERFFKDEDLLALCERIIGSYQTAPGKGLPIGTLTSQYWGNLYLGVVDRFITENLRARGYVRYMDDSALWSDDRAQLLTWRDAIAAFTQDHLALAYKLARIDCSDQGMPFLGARIFPGAVLLARAGRRRFAARLHAYERAHRTGRLDSDGLQRRVTALQAATGLADTGWRARVLARLPEGEV